MASSVLNCLFTVVKDKVLTIPTTVRPDVRRSENGSGSDDNAGAGVIATPSASQIVPINIEARDNSEVTHEAHVTYVFTLDETLKSLASQASLSVLQAWTMHKDMDFLSEDIYAVDSGFCDLIYIPELEMNDDNVNRRAVTQMHVHTAQLTPHNMDMFYEFVYCLQQQRLRLNSNRCVGFDRSWGIDAHVHFASESKTPFRCVDVLIKKEIDVALKTYRQLFLKFQRLKKPSASMHSSTSTIGLDCVVPKCLPIDASVADGIIGTRLLHLFVLDLLGHQTAAAAVYRNQIIEGYVMSAFSFFLSYAQNKNGIHLSLF